MNTVMVELYWKPMGTNCQQQSCFEMTQRSIEGTTRYQRDLAGTTEASREFRETQREMLAMAFDRFVAQLDEEDGEDLEGFRVQPEGDDPPAAVVELEARALRWFEESAAARPAQARRETDSADALKALGYVGGDGPGEERDG